ncbi:MAG: hypothetical protein AAFZ65_04985 [Planctomycetota bacterium]
MLRSLALVITGLLSLVTALGVALDGRGARQTSRYERAFDAWRASGDPLEAAPTDDNTGVDAAPAYREALREWQFAKRGVAHPLEEIEGSNFLGPEALAALRRLRELVPPQSLSEGLSLGTRAWRWYDELPQHTELLSPALPAWRLPEQGSARHDWLTLRVAMRERVLAAIRDSDADALARCMREDTWLASELAKVLTGHARMGRLEGDPARVAEALELTLSIDWASHSDWMLWDLLAALQPGLDAGGLADLRTALEAWDLEAEALDAMLNQRRADHALWLTARETGEPPRIGFGWNCIDDRSRWEHWYDETLGPIEERLWPEISTDEHARYLEGAARRIERMASVGLEAWRTDSIAFVPRPPDPDRLADKRLSTLCWIGQSRIDIEARRRLLLCSIAASLNGASGLDQALASLPDPRTGRPFERTVDDEGHPILVSPADPPARPGAGAVSWPLFY